MIKSGNLLKCSVCIVLSVIYFIDVPVNAWTYHFSHANVFHLCGNLISFTVISSSLIALPFAYLAASLFWLIDQNAIGFSGIVFFLWGSRIITDYATIKENSLKFRYSIGILATLTLPLIIPSLSFSVHFFSFLSGLVYNSITILIINYKNDLIKVSDRRPAHTRK